MRERVAHLPRRRSWPHAALALGLAGIALAWLAQPMRGGDTGPLFAGTEVLGECLANLDFVSCRQETPIGPYPLLQYLPDLLADAGAELSEGERVRVLTTLSGIGVAVAVFSGWIALRRVGRPEWGWGFLLVAVSGPTLAYGNTTWGEMLATGLLTSFVAASLLPVHPVLVGFAALGASLTKETGYPFVIVLGLIALVFARRRTGEVIRRHILLGGMGVGLGLALSAAFNLIRFGTPRNAYYLDPELRTTTTAWFIELAVGLFVSPSGGILFFWPLASLVVGALLLIPVLRVLRGTMSTTEAWPSLALITTVGALTAGLAAWWSPFGWWAWGPRLSLPWVLPVLLLSLAAFAPTLTPLIIRTLESTAGLAAVSTLAVVVALPHIGYLWRPETVGEFFFVDETSVCPGGGPPPTPAYYDCLHEQMWTRSPIWLDALAGLKTPQGVGTAGAVSLAIVGSLVLFRRDAENRARAV